MNSRKRTTSLIPVRIGALLVNSGLLSPNPMQAALVNARQTGRKIGEVLVVEKLISEADLECALELQSLIKEGSITMDMGTRALKAGQQSPGTAQQLLSDIGFVAPAAIGNFDLAAILLQSGCITQAQLDQGSWNTAKNSLPLGRNLVLTAAISPSTLSLALTALVLLREKRVDEQTACLALKEAVHSHGSVEEVLNLPAAAPAHRVRVGELLSAAGLLSESDAMIAVENGLLNHGCIGQVLLALKMVSPLVLDATLKLQAMIEQNSLMREQATELLRQVASEQVGLDTFLSEISFLRTQVLQLLLASGIISEPDLEAALQANPEYETDMVRALFACGALTQEVFRAAVRCAYSIAQCSYSKNDAITWLAYTFGPAPEDTVASA